MYQLTFKKSLVALSAALLTGCGTTKIVRDTPPAELLRDCPVPLVDITTNAGLAKGLLSYDDALKRCNLDKKALRERAEDE